MALLTKPDMQQVWASGGDIVEPSDLKKQQGWTVEVPPHQFENWIQNRQDEYLAHINQRGIPEWDGNTEYEAGGLSYVQGSDGVVYKSVAASGPSTVAQNPTTDVSDTYWTVAFASTTQATETVQGIVELATTAEAQTGTDDTRAMTALKVKQAIDQFAGGDLLNSAIATIAAAGTINLTTGAPNTSQIAISGSGVSINGFTVAANRFFIGKLSGANTLVNSASLITGTGANILTAAGDSFLMRSTAANTVEILCYFKAVSEFTSAGQTITLGGTLTIPHGLGYRPRSVVMDWLCTVADLGYSPGNYVYDVNASNSNASGITSLTADAVNIYVTYASSNVSLPNKTTGTTGNTTPARWSAIFRADR